MSAVDVLAVMDDHVRMAVYNARNNPRRPELQLDAEKAMQAHAAVAELIAAAEVHRDVRRGRWTKERKQVWQEVFGLPVYATASEIEEAAHDRLQAAIVRVGGAP